MQDETQPPRLEPRGHCEQCIWLVNDVEVRCQGADDSGPDDCRCGSRDAGRLPNDQVGQYVARRGVRDDHRVRERLSSAAAVGPSAGNGRVGFPTHRKAKGDHSGWPKSSVLNDCVLNLFRKPMNLPCAVSIIVPPSCHIAFSASCPPPTGSPWF